MGYYHHPIRLECRVILDWIEQYSPVLDLGCGNGALLSLLVQEKQVRAQGIDINEEAIHKCVAKGLSVIQENLEAGLSEYPDRSFDYVILNQSLQEVRKPGFVLNEALRVGKKTIVAFPNFAHYASRLQIFFGGKVPVTPALPYGWYDTPNLHFLSISDFIEYCKQRNINIDSSAFIGSNRRVKILPNLLAEIGVFLLSKEAKISK
ncbi:MAG: methionine biosynthesis protein MetW [Thaumarchaeota archaeon]|nr:methionine biosynthesis protein MetW [Nitrososphaerota archaeon]MCL5319021.1 methionine biosynthesis protein MetW [Nitrososphaerota archaeon]